MFAMFALIIYIVSYNSRVESVIEVIGNYKQLNPKNCGVSRLSPQVDTNCFEWHKELLPSLKNARNITIGEAPWMTLIALNVLVTELESNETIFHKAICGGTLIANQWIMTAAHCLANKNIDNQILINIDSAEIFFGYNFHYIPSAESNISIKSKEWYIHPKYIYNESIWNSYDIALIKLDKPINTSVYRIKSENNICLPQRRDQIKEELIEYGMLAGWSTAKPGAKEPESDYRLQISYWRIITNTSVTLEHNIFYASKLDNQLACHGDSGSPIWQYYEGRAVIIGVVSSTPIDNATRCTYEEFENTTGVPIFATSVSSQIDWIKSVTQLN